MATRRRVTVGDLRDGDNGAGRAFLYCTKCGERNSADARDYFAASLAHVFKHCGRNMIRVQERCTLVEA